MAGYPFRYKQNFQAPVEELKYAVGNPMGAYSS